MRVDVQIVGLAAIFALGLLAPGDSPAQAYPSKPVRFVVPFPAGGTGEVAMRVIAEKLEATLGQQFLVDARPGAGTVIAMRFVMSQPPDGYTLFEYSSSQAIRSAIPNPPFDVRKDLTHISGLVQAPPMLGVNLEKLPVRSVKELIAFAKARPGKLNFGNYGPGTTGHLVSVYLAQKAGIEVVHVPYKGTSELQNALVSGDVDLGFSGKDALQTRPDKVRILAVSTAERDGLSPDVAGMKESGLADFDVNVILSLAAPAGLPPAIVRTLNTAANAVLKDPTVDSRLRKMGLTPSGSTPEAVAAYIAREVETMGKVIRDGNLKIE
jgi:tripartite-type tricarboxylate transporter receptor subunit TctC